MYKKRSLAIGLFETSVLTDPFDNSVLDTLAYFNRKKRKFYDTSFIARRLQRCGINATGEEVENSLNLLRYYHLVERCEDSGCYRLSPEGKLDLRRN